MQICPHKSASFFSPSNAPQIEVYFGKIPLNLKCISGQANYLCAEKLRSIIIMDSFMSSGFAFALFILMLYQNTYQNEPEKQRNRAALDGSAALLKALEILYFVLFCIAVFLALTPWHSRGQRFDPAYLHQTESRYPIGYLLFVW